MGASGVEPADAMLHERHWTIEDANAVLPVGRPTACAACAARATGWPTIAAMSSLPSIAVVTGGAWPGRESARSPRWS